MSLTKLIVFCFIVALFSSCGMKKLTPATEVVYEGPLAGDGVTTYPSATKVVQSCMQVKICMGLSDMDYPLPEIRGMSGGNAVQCGDKLKEGCYTSDGVITVLHGGDADIIAHECVHHWLYLHTGDLDPFHESEYFLECGGSLRLTEDSL